LAFVALSFAACDGKDGIVYEDGGVDAPVLPDAPRDVDAPSVLSTTPADGAGEVERDTTVSVRFDEAMDPTRGSVEVAGTTYGVDDGAWSDTTWTLTPDVPFEEGARVQVALEDFRDVAGNALPTYRFEFTVRRDAPTVVTSDPAEGATVSARLDVLRFELSEPMDNARGSVTIDGGATVGEVRWIAENELEVDVEGLVYERTYRVALTGFRDRAGTELAADALGDGVLDFATGEDGDAPRVMDANPAEGQLDVDFASPTITIVFDEAMATDVGEARLVVDTLDVALDGTWNAAGTTLTLDVAGLLRSGGAHRVVLTGFTDVAGNALPATDAFLVDDALDFQTGRDLATPFVGFSDPFESQGDVTFQRERVVVFFSEAMARDVDTVTFVGDDGRSFDATGTWSLSGTRLTLDVRDRLQSGRAYTIDLSGFRDLGGATVDATHPYLIDGVLDFSLVAPRGERCNDALEVAQATTTDGVHVWTIDGAALSLQDGSGTCDETSSGNDAVVRYVKTTADTAGGGTVLAIRVENTAGANVEIFRDLCDPRDLAADAARLKCLWNNDDWEAYLDVGPGEYFVWAMPTSSSTAATTVTIRELALPPEGETCLAPWTTASAIYTPPATPDDYGVFTLPAGAFQSFDRDVTWNRPGTPQCDADYASGPIVGADGVLQITKTDSDSTLEILLEVDGTTSVNTFLVAELLDRCDPLAAGAVSLECRAALRSADNPHQFFFDGAAGTYFLWLHTDRTGGEIEGARVRVKETRVTPGDSCEDALPLVPDSSNVVTPTGTQRLFAPSCAPDAPLTWYRFTTTSAMTVLSTDVAAAVGVVDAASGGERACTADATAGRAIFAAVGTDVCVAVPSGAVGRIDLAGRAYDGVLGRPTALSIDRPLNASGSTATITADNWMTVTPSTLYMGVGTSSTTVGLLRAPKVGGVQAELLQTGITTREMGNAGASVGEAVFSVDESTTIADGDAYTFRLVGTSGIPATEAWDTGNAYQNDVDAMGYDGTELLLATDVSTGAPDTFFYALDPTTPGSSRSIGRNSVIEDVTAIAGDATHVYVLGNTGTTASEGLYRLRRDQLGDVAQVPEAIHLVALDDFRAKLFLHRTATTTYAYFRDDAANLHVADVGAATPTYLGILSEIGGSADDAFAFDPTGPAIYLFETESLTTGNFVRLD
jgi:hypothetical protein